MRLWAMNCCRKSAIAGPGHATQPSASRKRRWPSRGQQRVTIVQPEQEIEPAARRLDRVEHPEAGAAGPGGERAVAQDPLGEQPGDAAGELLGEAERHARRVSTGLPKVISELRPSLRRYAAAW